MCTVTLNTNNSLISHPTSATNESVWKGRKVTVLPPEESCLTQKGIRFSDRIAMITAPAQDPIQNVEIIYFDWNAEEPEWQFAAPAPYISPNYEENLTVEELLEKTGYKFATYDELEVVECKKVKDRIVGWWKSGVKWAKEHKKELIIAGIVLGGTGLTVGVALFVSSALAETAVATGAAAGAAAAAGSGSSKKEEEENKPQTNKEIASAPPPSPEFNELLPPKPEKPEAPKETASASSQEPPAFIPPFDFRPPTREKPQPPKASGSTATPPAGFQSPANAIASLPTFFSGPVDFADPRFFHNQIQDHAKIYFDYLNKHAATPAPSPSTKPEEHLFSSMFQTIQNGLCYLGLHATDNLDLFHPNSPDDPFHKAYEDLMKEHNIPATSLSPKSAPPFLSIAPLKSAYHDYLNLLAIYSSDVLQRPVPIQPPRSIYFTIDGAKSKSTQVTVANGMDNIYLEAVSNANYVKSMTSLRIEGIYNRTNGKPLDLLEIVTLNFAGYSPNTEGLIMKKFIDFDEANKDDPHAKCLHECHSQSALHTRNVLEKLPKHVRDRVLIVNIAGACVIPRRLCFQSYNYVSDRDIVPNLQYYYKGGLMANLSDEEQQEILNQEKLDAQEIIVLKAHEGATKFDHAFQSPTYTDVLKKHLTDYEMREGRY